MFLDRIDVDVEDPSRRHAAQLGAAFVQPGGEQWWSEEPVALVQEPRGCEDVSPDQESGKVESGP